MNRCHTGSCSRHIHQLAHMKISARLPCKLRETKRLAVTCTQSQVRIGSPTRLIGGVLSAGRVHQLSVSSGRRLPADAFVSKLYDVNYPRTSSAHERLISSACQLLHAGSYASTSVEDLCAAAGVHIG